MFKNIFILSGTNDNIYSEEIKEVKQVFLPVNNESTRLCDHNPDETGKQGVQMLHSSFTIQPLTSGVPAAQPPLSQDWPNKLLLKLQHFPKDNTSRTVYILVPITSFYYNAALHQNK